MIVEVYGKDGCGYCTAAVQLLQSKNIRFTEQKLGIHFTREMLLERFPHARTFPVIVVDGMHIGGYNELDEEIKKMSSQQIFLSE